MYHIKDIGHADVYHVLQWERLCKLLLHRRTCSRHHGCILVCASDVGLRADLSRESPPSSSSTTTVANRERRSGREQVIKRCKDRMAGKEGGSMRCEDACGYRCGSKEAWNELGIVTNTKWPVN